MKNYGIKWVNEDTAFNGFLAIFNHKHDTLPDWIKQVQPLFHDNEKLFLRFLAIIGLRKNEALTSFNMIIELNAKGKLCEYYNEDLYSGAFQVWQIIPQRNKERIHINSTQNNDN